MKTYLITGCAGFIGSNFVHYMLKKYPEILLVNLDKLTYAGNLENLKDVEGDPRHVFVQGDICDKELVEGLFRIGELIVAGHRSQKRSPVICVRGDFPNRFCDKIPEAYFNRAD